MNSYDVNYKNYYSSRNRSLTKDQRLILRSYKKKISLESFLLSKKIKKYEKRSLEIGFGTGEILIYNAMKYPETFFMGVEYYKRGIANLLMNIEKKKLDNIRVFYGDASQYLQAIATRTFSEVLIMFPDPWPKKRHWKRRFINTTNVNELSRILKLRGKVLFFTDNDSLAFWGLRHFIQNKNFLWSVDKPIDCRTRINSHLMTRYESKALTKNINPYYFKFTRQ